ncbi:MAG: hypothetical protein SNI49_08655 [Rikenellaceae bacterium]
MKNLYYYICAIIILSLTSCEGILSYDGNTPYDLDTYNLKQNVKTVEETEYSVKFVNKVAQKSKVNKTKTFAFNALGRLTSLESKVDGKKDVSNFNYDPSGKFLGTDDMNGVDVTYNDKLDIVKISYQTSNGFDCVNEYVYNASGFVTSEKFTCKNSEYGFTNTTTTTYKNTVRSKYRTNNDAYQTIVYTCDKNGDVVLEETYEVNEKKPSLKATFTYEYDNHGNWIKCTRREKYTKSITERKIAYYTDKEIAAAKSAPPVSNNNSTFAKNAGSEQPITAAGFFGNIVSKLTNPKALGGPSTTLLIVVIALTAVISGWIIYENRAKLSNFSGVFSSNGMKRLWMYNSQPYSRVASYIIVVLAAFLMSIVVLFLFGGGTLAIFWVLKICITILIWVGIICTILGGLLLWGGSPYGLLLGIPGVIVWIYSKDMEAAGNRLVNNGFEFMNNLNMFRWGVNLFANYWDVLLAIFILPMLMFSIFALLIIVVNTILNLSELLITKIYNVRRPCPVCGSTSGYHYLVAGKVHPVSLRPGLYGILSHTSPVDGSKLPTMLFNGKAKLDRECKSCHAKVTAKMEGQDNSSFGTDIHIGVVGHRSSGKSYLLYSGLSLLQSQYPDRLSQIDADNDTAIVAKKKRIDAGGDIQTDEKSQYRAIQLMLKDKFRAVPYHLFFYDVAGEKFNAASKAHLSAMDFYRNVESIVFVIDPIMVDFTGIPANDDLLNWIERKDKQGRSEKNNIGNTFTILKEILEKAGRKSKKIDFSFVCVKMDLGYFEAMNYDSSTITPKEVEQFIRRDMALNNVVNAAKAEFKSVNFAAVSATSKDTAPLKDLFVSILKQKGIKL